LELAHVAPQLGHGALRIGGPGRFPPFETDVGIEVSMTLHESIMEPKAEKIALFIDGANLYATAKSLGFDIDYKRLLSEFQSRGYLLRAFYYTAVIEDQEYSSIRPLVSSRSSGQERQARPLVVGCSTETGSDAGKVFSRASSSASSWRLRLSLSPSS
jgi:hypothetical protein